MLDLLFPQKCLLCRKILTDAELDFRIIAENDPPLKGSFFDLMTEVRTTPENASESLRDFLDRSLKML